MAWEAESLKLLRDDLHANQRGNRELVEAARDLHCAVVDLTIVIRSLRDELVLLRLDSLLKRSG